MISCSLQKKNNLLLNFVSYCDQKVNPENEKLRPEDTIQPKCKQKMKALVLENSLTATPQILEFKPAGLNF